MRVALQWSAALAAMLLVGIGIGRFTARARVTPAPDVGAAASVDAGAARLPYVVAASHHMERAELLLTSLAVDGATRGTPELSASARDQGGQARRARRLRGGARGGGRPVRHRTGPHERGIRHPPHRGVHRPGAECDIEGRRGAAQSWSYHNDRFQRQLLHILHLSKIV